MPGGSERSSWRLRLENTIRCSTNMRSTRTTVRLSSDSCILLLGNRENNSEAAHLAVLINVFAHNNARSRKKWHLLYILDFDRLNNELQHYVRHVHACADRRTPIDRAESGPSCCRRPHQSRFCRPPRMPVRPHCVFGPRLAV